MYTSQNLYQPCLVSLLVQAGASDNNSEAALSHYLATNSGYHEYLEGGAGNLRVKDKSTGENSDATTKGDSADIDVDEACALQCLY